MFPLLNKVLPKKILKKRTSSKIVAFKIINVFISSIFNIESKKPNSKIVQIIKIVSQIPFQSYVIDFQKVLQLLLLTQRHKLQHTQAIKL